VEEEARKGFRAQLLLDAVAEAEQVSVGQRELIEYLVQMSQQYGMDPNSFAKAVDEAGQVPSMVGEVARRKALAAVLARAVVTDASGNTVDLESLFGSEDDVEDEEDLAEGEDEVLELDADQGGRTSPPVVAAAADPAAVSLSSVGGFVPDEPAAQA